MGPVNGNLGVIKNSNLLFFISKMLLFFVVVLNQLFAFVLKKLKSNNTVGALSLAIIRFSNNVKSVFSPSLYSS